LEYTDVPDPKLSQNSALVRVLAAALNPADDAAEETTDAQISSLGGANDSTTS
jgi:NADPH:quinone reductase-like Zn-dependent oxidoreductase